MTEAEKSNLVREIYEGQLAYLRRQMYAARRAYNNEAISHLAGEIREVKIKLGVA